MRQSKVQGSRRGFTLIELCLTLGIILLLLAIAIPPLGIVRDNGLRIKCQSHLREVARIVASYTIDARGVYPSLFAASEADVSIRPWGWYYAHQHYMWDATPRTPSGRYFLPDYAGLDPRSWIFYCPANEHRRLGRWTDGGLQDQITGFDIARSMYIDPAFLDPDLPASQWRGRSGAKLQGPADVLYPSDKADVYEKHVWHGWRDRAQYRTPGLDWSPLEAWNCDAPTSVSFVDGHVEGLHVKGMEVRAKRQPMWGGLPLMLTDWGVRGRDRRPQ